MLSLRLRRCCCCCCLWRSSCCCCCCYLLLLSFMLLCSLPEKMYLARTNGLILILASYTVSLRGLLNTRIELLILMCLSLQSMQRFSALLPAPLLPPKSRERLRIVPPLRLRLLLLLLFRFCFSSCNTNDSLLWRVLLHLLPSRPPDDRQLILRMIAPDQHEQG